MRRYSTALLVLLLSLGLLAPAGLATAQSTGTPPQGDWWQVPEEENRDLPPGLAAYHEVAPRLRDIARRSERVQVEVVGQSAQGRDIYGVTVSDPSSGGRFGHYQELRQLMERDPAAAQRRAEQIRDFKVPVYVNGSIHGNEWEGVDASLELIERLAFEDDPETRAVLDNMFVIFNPVANPDGRVLGQRANGNGFDLNRDHITQSQPETDVTVRQVTRWNPMVLWDLHGYVNPFLMGPASPPHNPNYELDLHLGRALPMAYEMQDALSDQLGLNSHIMHHDRDTAWDDYPPIFTPMYNIHHGGWGYTLETPLRPGPNLSDEVREERARTNVAALSTAVWASMQYVAEHRVEMFKEQVEVYRRGVERAEQVSVADEYGEVHDYVREFAEAHVIPMSEDQNEVAAARLVNFLLDNGVVVEQARRPFPLDGTDYPAGSYIVPLDQPKRGLANTILEDGDDITDRVFGVARGGAAWSLGRLWGALVHEIPPGEELAVTTSPVRQHQQARGQVEPGPAEYYALVLDDKVAVQVTNRLLDDGVPLERATSEFDGLPAGTVLIPASARPAVQRIASSEGLDFHAVASGPDDRTDLEPLRVASSVTDEERHALSKLGFEVEHVSTSQLNQGASLSGYDVFMVSSGFNYNSLNAQGRAALDGFVEAGGGVVTRGTTGASFNAGAGLLDVSYSSAVSRANGIVSVDNTPGSPVVGDFSTDDTTFVDGPLWFHSLGEGIEVDQSFGGGDMLVAGHWNNWQDARGQAAVIHGTAADGARVVMFGTDPLFRDHPKKLYPQVANALWWAAAR